MAAAVNWGAAFIVSVTFLSLIDAIGEVATFLLFAVLCVAAFVWIKAKVPETKGKSLEEIQEVWAEHDAELSAPRLASKSTSCEPRCHRGRGPGPPQYVARCPTCGRSLLRAGPGVPGRWDAQHREGEQI